MVRDVVKLIAGAIVAVYVVSWRWWREGRYEMGGKDGTEVVAYRCHPSNPAWKPGSMS